MPEKIKRIIEKYGTKEEKIIVMDYIGNTIHESQEKGTATKEGVENEYA
ncbi:hypothetical protein [Ligilactobacillus aviarius]|nr:hypothetical protein [Ligilactobacillus aviarius]MBM6863189.1 hypothetical protein [Ligilactobacillus aviarius]